MVAVYNCLSVGFSFFPDYGILGLNARGLDYIRPFNHKKAVRMADDKLATKHFLSTRGIPVPRLFATIRSLRELDRFDFSTLPDSFVLKPNAGFGGEGILVIDRRDGDAGWIKVNGAVVSREEVYDHIRDILDGKFSIAALPDIAFFEQRVNSVDFIPGLDVQGLPDIRVIVHNLIPVMAMLRVPTPASDGKANVHLGGYGFGIDLAKGETTYCTQYNKLIAELPGGVSPSGHAISHFNEVLTIASSAQLHTNLGYLAADIVIDEKDGPVLLETNARAGLMVQVANRAGLRTRLTQVRGLKVDSPEQGVALGQELFGRGIKKKDAHKDKVVLGYIEPGEIILDEGTHRVRAELDPTHETTAIDTALATKLGLDAMQADSQSVLLKFRIGGQRIQTAAVLTDLSADDYKVILGRRDLAGFLIDPKPPTSKTLPTAEPKREVPVHDYHALDTALMGIDAKIKLLYHLKPTNLLSEQKKFNAKKGDYNPQFHYPQLRFDPAELRAELRALSFPETPLGQIFREKKVEIERKIALLEAVGSADFTARSGELYGQPTTDTIRAAERIMQQRPAKFAPDPATLDARMAAREFTAAFKRYGLKNWQVKLKDDLASDALANKKGVLFLRSDAVFAPKRLAGTIAHEVGTHVLRGENGAQQPFDIFSRGLANYLETEEGLAMYNQELVMPAESEKKYWSVLGTLAVHFAATHSFAELHQFIRDQGFDDDRAWKTTLKIKRGIKDTSAAGGFTKEHVYFSGYLKIKAFVENGGDLKELYAAKMKLEDLPIVSNMPEIKAAKHVPDFYHI